MSDKVVDNFTVIKQLEDSLEEKFEYESDSNCFDLKDKIELGASWFINTPIKMIQTLNLIKNSTVESCEDLISLITSIDDFFENNPFIDKLKEIFFCYLFNKENLELIADLIGIEKLRDFFDALAGWKESIEIFTKMEESELEEISEFDGLSFEEFDKAKEELGMELKIIIDDFLDILEKRFNISIISRLELENELESFSIEDFFNRDDFFSTISAIFKTLYKVENHSEGVIGTYIINRSVQEHINTFSNTYFSIFDFMIKDFDLNFSSVEDFYENYSEEDLEHLNFLFYIMDSFKFDVLILREKLIMEYFLKILFKEWFRDTDGVYYDVEYGVGVLAEIESKSILYEEGGQTFVEHISREYVRDEKDVTYYPTQEIHNKLIVDHMDFECNIESIRNVVEENLFTLFDYLKDKMGDKFIGGGHYSRAMIVYGEKFSDWSSNEKLSDGFPYPRFYHGQTFSYVDKRIEFFRARNLAIVYGYNKGYLRRHLYNFFKDKNVFKTIELEVVDVNNEPTLVEIADDFLEDLGDDISSLKKDLGL